MTGRWERRGSGSLLGTARTLRLRGAAPRSRPGAPSRRLRKDRSLHLYRGTVGRARGPSRWSRLPMQRSTRSMPREHAATPLGDTRWRVSWPIQNDRPAGSAGRCKITWYKRSMVVPRYSGVWASASVTAVRAATVSSGRAVAVTVSAGVGGRPRKSVLAATTNACSGVTGAGLSAPAVVGTAMVEPTSKMTPITIKRNCWLRDGTRMVDLPNATGNG